jgi:hypothetical protein
MTREDALDIVELAIRNGLPISSGLHQEISDVLVALTFEEEAILRAAHLTREAEDQRAASDRALIKEAADKFLDQLGE